MTTTGTRVMWWRVNWMFARPVFTDQVVPRRMHAVNWRWARRGTIKRMRHVTYTTSNV